MKILSLIERGLENPMIGEKEYLTNLALLIVILKYLENIRLLSRRKTRYLILVN